MSYDHQPTTEPEDEEYCDICGEPFRPNDERGEFFDEHDEWSQDSFVAHAQCGLSANLSIA